MSMIPMNNLTQNGFERSSAQPGVSGESVNAPYGPKACEYDDIESLKSSSDTFNHAEDGWAVGGVGNLTQTKEQSSLRP